MNGGTTQPAEPDAKINVKTVSLWCGAIMGIVAVVGVPLKAYLDLTARIAKVEQDADTTAKFWKIHAQTRDAINDDRAAAGKALFKWDID